MSLFRKHKTTDQRNINGLLVLSDKPLQHGDAVILLQQIIGEQGKRGHKMAEHARADVMVASDSLNDPQYVNAAIGEAFSELGGSDLWDRTEHFSFKGSDGSQGRCFMLFDRPREESKDQKVA